MSNEKSRMRSMMLEEKAQQAKEEAAKKYEQHIREETVKRMQGVLAPPVAGSNTRVLDNARKKRELKESAAHRNENLQKSVIEASRKAKVAANKQIRALSSTDREQYLSDIASRRKYEEQKTIPKAIRTGQLTVEQYEKYKENAMIYRRKVKNGEIQVKPRTTTIETQSITVKPLSHLRPKFNSTPLMPPCSQTDISNIDSGSDIDIAAEIERQQGVDYVQYHKRKDRYYKRLDEIGDTQITELNSITKYPELLNMLINDIKIITIKDLTAISLNKLIKYCEQHSVKITRAMYMEIRTELIEKYNLKPYKNTVNSYLQFS